MVTDQPENNKLIGLKSVRIITAEAESGALSGLRLSAASLTLAHRGLDR